MSFTCSDTFKAHATSFENSHSSTVTENSERDIEVPKLYRNDNNKAVTNVQNDITKTYNFVSPKNQEKKGDFKDKKSKFIFSGETRAGDKSSCTFDFFSESETGTLRLKNEKTHLYLGNKHFQLNSDISSTSSSLTDFPKEFGSNSLVKVDVSIIDDVQDNKNCIKNSGVLHSILKKTSSLTPTALTPEHRSSTFSDRKSVNSSFTIASTFSGSSKMVRFASNNDLVRVKTFNNGDEPNCLNNSNCNDETNLQSKEFIGMNLRYCLKEWYLEEKTKERNERIEKLKQKNKGKSDSSNQKENKDSQKKSCFSIASCSLKDHTASNSDTEFDKSTITPEKYFQDDSDYTDESSSDYSFEDDGLNFKRNNTTRSSSNFTSSQDWNTKPYILSKKVFSPDINSKKRSSLTNLSTFNYHLRSLEEQKPRASSLDNVKNFGLLPPKDLKINYKFKIIESNFDYKKNIFSPYPWQYKSKTVEMKHVSFNSELNKIAVYLSAQNLAYEKNLEVKYSFNNWNTIYYSTGIFSKQISNNFDEFKCIIELPNESTDSFVTNLTFCCKYEVNGLIYYDNNNYNNFKMKIQTDKNRKSCTSLSKISEVASIPPDCKKSRVELKQRPPLQSKDLCVNTSTPQKASMTRKFDNSKEFYNTSPWKNLYMHESFTNIFKNDKNDLSNQIFNDTPVEPFEKTGFDSYSVIQNHSETSDSVLTSDDDDIVDSRKEFLDATNLDLGLNFQKRRYSFSSTDSKSGHQCKKGSLNNNELDKSPTPLGAKNGSLYQIRNPLVNKFQNDLKLSTNDELYGEFKENPCLFSTKPDVSEQSPVNKKAVKQLDPAYKDDAFEHDEKLSKSSNNTIKDYKSLNFNHSIDYLFTESNNYSYEILFPAPSFVNNSSSKYNNYNLFKDDRASPRVFQTSQDRIVDSSALTTNSVKSDTTLNLLK